ncbi:MAG: lecithin retinol acyltransferase family protein [Sarcina sp.]
MNIILSKNKGIVSKIGDSINPLKKAILNIDFKNRRQREKVFYEVGHNYGEVMKNINNFTDTVVNACDATFKGVGRLFDDEERVFEIGAHLFVQRKFYTHHAVYIGKGRVVHYLQEKVMETSIKEFACGAKVFSKSDKDSPRHFLKSEVVKRAFSRIGESKYNLAVNNCENFAKWCRNGFY